MAYNKKENTWWEELDLEQQEKLNELVRLKNKGLTNLQVAITMNLSERQIYRLLKQIKMNKEVEG